MGFEISTTAPTFFGDVSKGGFNYNDIE